MTLTSRRTGFINPDKSTRQKSSRLRLNIAYTRKAANTKKMHHVEMSVGGNIQRSIDVLVLLKMMTMSTASWTSSSMLQLLVV